MATPLISDGAASVATKSKPDEAEEGELEDDDDDDNFSCKVCNIQFAASKPYYTHIHSVSHLTRSQSFSQNNMEKTESPDKQAASRRDDTQGISFTDHQSQSISREQFHVGGDGGLRSGWPGGSVRLSSPSVPPVRHPFTPSRPSVTPLFARDLTTSRPVRPQVSSWSDDGLSPAKLGAMSADYRAGASRQPRDHIPGFASLSPGLAGDFPVRGVSGVGPGMMDVRSSVGNFSAMRAEQSRSQSELSRDQMTDVAAEIWAARFQSKASSSLERDEIRSPAFYHGSAIGRSSMTRESSTNSLDNRQSSFSVDRSPVSQSGRKVLTMPLLEGCWRVDLAKVNQRGFFSCDLCSAEFTSSVSHQMHLAGLRHKTVLEKQQHIMTSIATSISQSEFRQSYHDDRKERDQPMEIATEKSSAVKRREVVEEENVAQPTVALVNKCPARSFAAFEEFLYKRPDPVLGFDYVTEYRHSSGRSEYVCDLCEVTFSTAEGVTQHITSRKHSLTYLDFHDPDLHRLVSCADKSSTGDQLKVAAESVEKRLGCRHHMRVKVESADSRDKQRSAWTEVEDDRVRAVSDLPGHRLKLGFSHAAPSADVTSSFSVGRLTSTDAFLKSLAMYDCLLSGRPPSKVGSLDRITFLQSLISLEMRSEKTADVCLQLANAITIALVQFRLQQLPSLDAIDTSKLSEKLHKLCKTAENVGDKMLLAESTEMSTPSTMPSSANI